MSAGTGGYCTAANTGTLSLAGATAALANPTCSIPCSGAGDSSCVNQRATCDTGTMKCGQCTGDDQCVGYPGTVYCDLTTISGFGICSSCPSTGCTVGTCQDFRCVECDPSLNNCPAMKPFCVQKFEGNFCQECQSSGDCNAAALSRCDDGTCVICSGVADCTHINGRPYCSGSLGCVQCFSDGECSGSTPYCIAGTCQACPDDPFCAAKFVSSSPQKNACSASGSCVPCINQSHCLTTSAPYCVANNCQPCSDGALCVSLFGTAQPVCFSGTCLQCAAHSDCAGTPATRYCSAYTCVACPDDTFCNARFGSNTPPLDHCVSGVCQACGDDSHCSTGQLCDNGNCVQCITHGDCSFPSPYCISNTCQACPGDFYCVSEFSTAAPFCVGGKCVGCSVDGDCGGNTPYCLNDYCDGCTDDTWCNSNFGTPLDVCSNGNCVECTSSSGTCTGATPYCSTAGACVECLSNADCPSVSNSFCDGTGSCSPCNGDNDCSHFGTTKKCLATTHTCVQCASNSHCTNPLLSACDSTSHACQSCSGDPDCSHITGKTKCTAGECVPAIEPCPASSQNIHMTQDENEFTFVFPASVASSVTLLADLQLSLMNIPSSQYSYVLTKPSSNVILATFSFGVTIPATTLQLTLPCPLVAGHSFTDIVLQFPTSKVLYNPPGVQQTTQTITAVTTAATTAMAGVSGSMMMAGANPAIMWALIGLLQTFYFLIFINVEYPANVVPFFKLFAMGNLSFLPNPTAWIFPNIDNESLDAPAKFMDNDLNGLFLQTGGEMLLTWFVVLLCYGASLLLLKYTRNMPRALTLGASKTVDIFEWSGVFRTLITSYTQLALAAFLQVRVLDYSSLLFALSSVFGIIFVIFTVAMPVLTLAVVYKYQKRPKYMEKKFVALVEELKRGPESLLPKYINVLFLLRRFALAATLVFLHDYPYVEVALLIVNYFGWALLLCKYLPYESKLNNAVNIMTEVTFTGIHIIIFLLVHDDFMNSFSDNLRLTLGWVIIGCCGVILVVTLAASFVQQYGTMKELWALLKKVLIKENKSGRVKMMDSKRKEIKEVDNNNMNSSANTSISMAAGSMSRRIYPMKQRKLDLTTGDSSVVELKNIAEGEGQFGNSLTFSKWTLESLPKRNKKF